MLEFEPIPVLQDNYVWLITDTQSDAVGVVDPAVAGDVIDVLKSRGLNLTHILNTHHHWDHIGGNEKLVKVYKCHVVGPASETSRIPGMDEMVQDGDMVSFGTCTAQVFEVPGHTTGHIAFWFGDDGVLFCGDTLFSIGCGRLFEGTPEQMWHSLQKLKALPDETRVCCAHEYTQDNIRFARTIDPDNRALQKRAAEVEELRKQGRPTLPAILGEEKATNPFLRADTPDIAKAVGMSESPPEDVFAEIRGRKDRF